MKHLEQIRGILLCGLGSLGLGLLLCRLLTRSPSGAWLLALAGCTGGLLGALPLNRSRAAAAVLLSVGVAAAIAVGFGRFQSVLLALCMAAAVLLCFAAMTVGGYGFCGPLGCWSVVLLTGAALFSGAFGSRWQTAASLCAILALALTLDGFRDRSLRRGQHLGRDVPAGHAPGLRGNSLLLCGLFLAGAVAAALGLMGLWLLLSGAVKGLLHLLLNSTGRFGSFLAQLLQRFMLWLVGLRPDEPEDYVASAKEMDWPSYEYEGSPASTLVLTLLIAAGAAAALTLTVLTVARAATARARKRRKPASPEVCDYVDEIERLERPRRRPFGRWNRRKPRMSDYQGTMKIRFAFQQLLRKRMETDTLSRAKTPNELREPDQADQNVLIDAYNRVRYGGRGVTDEELAAAERFLKNN